MTQKTLAKGLRSDALRSLVAGSWLAASPSRSNHYCLGVSGGRQGMRQQGMRQQGVRQQSEQTLLSRGENWGFGLSSHGRYHIEIWKGGRCGTVVLRSLKVLWLMSGSLFPTCFPALTPLRCAR